MSPKPDEKSSAKSGPLIIVLSLFLISAVALAAVVNQPYQESALRGAFR